MSRYNPDKKPESLAALAPLILAAQAELSALCNGKRFRMSIPVDDADSDMVIGDALRHALAFVHAALSASRTPNEPTPALEPPSHIVSLAIEVSGWSPCRSKRGVVIFSEGNILSHGHNYKPRGFECDGSVACKATCRRDAIHAEQQALMGAGARAHASEMLHVKTVDGQLVSSGGPSCVECSKLARAAGIAWVWLYHDTGWRRYDGAEFHRLSLAASSVSSAPTPALKPFDGIDITAVIRRIAELPDRTSPADWPQALLVTADELAWILAEANLAALALSSVRTPETKDRT